jgi:hypothetical protein
MSKKKRTLKTLQEQHQIIVTIYSYTDENGKKIYDFEEMQRKFERKLEKLKDE